ncbi:MAG: hypothetical protein ACREQY_13610 [Candidatus Binatia bacterium]
MTDDEATAFPDTPAGRAVVWFLRHAATNGRDLTIEEIVEHMRFEPPWTPEDSLERFREGAPQDRRIIEIRSPSASEVEYFEVDPAGRRWRALCRVEDAPPHRITFFEFRADLGPGVELRQATAEDTAKLAEVERQAPIIAGDLRSTYDRGDDFLSFARLMEENVFYVVEKDGELLGLYGAATHTVRSDGKLHRAMLAHHLRIPAAQEKKGYFSALNMRLFDHYTEIYGPWWKGGWYPYGYVLLANVAGMRLGAPGSWSVGALRALLDCEALAGEDHGAVAAPDDAGRIAGIINACHDTQAMFVPYTVESLTARMDRAPDLYTWSDVLVGDGAVVGVWPSGLRVITEGEGVRREAVRASMLDHGFVPGAEDEFERIIRAWGGRLLDAGHTELSFITSEPSPAYPILERLAFQMDAFDFKMAIPEPEDAKTNGLYVDPIYF